MKKILGSCFLAMMLLLSFSAVAFAAGPTTVTVDWTGGGVVGGVVGTGDTTTTFNANISNGTGHFTAADSNDNPYGYAVDSQSAYITGAFSNGSMYFETVRNTSYVPMYGVAGQAINAFVGSSGTGEMATGSGTNYAAMGNGTYGQSHTSGGYNFEAVAGGGSYTIYQNISALAAISGFTSTGTGSAKINDMTTGASGVTSINLGWGGGCYTNANALFTGVGSFGVGATGSNSITTPIAGASGTMVAGGWTGNGNGSFGSVAFNAVMNFANGGSVGNYSVKVQ